MEKCIDLSKSNYKTHVPLDIVAFTYAEDGTIRIVTRQSQFYSLNFFYDDWDTWGQILEICPQLNFIDVSSDFQINEKNIMSKIKEFCPRFKYGISILNGWHSIYLGLGHYLYISDCIKDEFMAKSEIRKDRLYLEMPDIVRGILADGDHSNEA